MEILKTDNRKRYKFKQITVEGVDDFIRKFRVTGVVSLRGGGYLIDINQYEIEKIKYVLNNYISRFDNSIKKDSKESYVTNFTENAKQLNFFE